MAPKAVTRQAALRERVVTLGARKTERDQLCLMLRQLQLPRLARLVEMKR
jgi:hypothetical protein